MSEEHTHFGYSEVTPREKTRKVREVFDSVSSKYDIMNDLMSLGLHRIWKQLTHFVLPVRAGNKVLDLAGGTGDLAAKFVRDVGHDGLVIVSDINNSMLCRGRDRLTDKGFIENVSYVQANGENLPFEQNSFDLVTMAFGLRNVTDKAKCLSSIHRVLKPGGQLAVLEFSQPVSALKGIYDFYSFSVLPKLGEWVAKDRDSYQYLAESIRMHPNQEALKDMFVGAGFERCSYMNMSGGIVALHRGYKF